MGTSWCIAALSLAVTAVLSGTPPEARSCVLIDLDAVGGTWSTGERVQLHKLYGPESEALWLDADGRPSRNAIDALALLDHADDDGLDPAEYRRDDMERFRTLLGSTSTSLEDRRHFDVALSANLLRYLRHLHLGRVDPRRLGFRLTVWTEPHDFVALLRAAIAAKRIPALSEDLRPPLAQYRALRAALARYRTLAASPIPTVPSSRIPVRPGDPYNGADAMHRQLVVLGDLAGDTAAPAPGLYEAALAAGVARFQARHGLLPDGVIGHGTLAALRVPLAWRVRQIELALERLRWLPDLVDGPLLLINIPMFHLWALDSIPPRGAPARSMGVIVGRAALDLRTPVFVEHMETVIFRPYWNVPASIVAKEILPALSRDPTYLQRQHMEIVRGAADTAPVVDATPENVKRLAGGELRLRQRPGRENALGLIKFVFPNEEGVYLHGTPAQALFARNRRDFSHGCVRVEDPVTLAEWVLKDQPEWTRERILQTIGGEQSIRVMLQRPIQVILFYATAVVMPEDGTVRFADDPYGHDARLDRALRARAPVGRTPARAGARLPGTDAPGVHVDEVGGRIVADATAANLERSAIQRGKRHVGEPDVDGLALHVQAARRDPFAPMTEHLVGCGRAVPGDHLERQRRLRRPGQLVEQVQQAGIDPVDVAGAEIAQEVVHRSEGVRHVRPAGEVLDSEMLARMRMREGQCPAGG
jgi:murein L,D-transpeptidase YcbB/YkuD